jgi:hypothetical protein
MGLLPRKEGRKKSRHGHEADTSSCSSTTSTAHRPHILLLLRTRFFIDEELVDENSTANLHSTVTVRRLAISELPGQIVEFGCLWRLGRVC